MFLTDAQRFQSMTDEEIREDISWHEEQLPGCRDGMEAGKYLNAAHKGRNELQRRILERELEGITEQQ